MRTLGRSACKGVAATALVALVATGCSAQDSRSASGVDAGQVEGNSVEGGPSGQVTDPRLSPSPDAPEGDQPVDTPSESALLQESGSASPMEPSVAPDGSGPSATDPGPKVGLILDVIGLGFDLIGLAFDIADAASAGGTAQATDLTEVYQRLDRIESSLEQSRAENQARFSELQNELNRQGMEASIRQFIDIENNGDQAMRAWLVIHQCRINRARAEQSCPDLGGVRRPIDDSILRARSTLIDVVDNRWSNLDIPTLAGAYTSRGAGRGLIEAAWNFLRTKQNNAAKVPAASPVRSGEKMPVITPELSSGMNSIIEYYAVLIARYAFLRQVAVLEKDPTQNGCQWYEHVAEFFRVNVCQRRLIEQIGQEADRWIAGSGSGSVLQAAARYKMPIVPTRAIAIAGIAEGLREPRTLAVLGDATRRILFFSSDSRPPKPTTPYQVQPMRSLIISGRLVEAGENDFTNMLAVLQKYSGASNFIRAYPDSFTFVAGRDEISAQEEGYDLMLGRCTNLALFDLTSETRTSSCADGGRTPNWVTREVREANTDYPMFGW